MAIGSQAKAPSRCFSAQTSYICLTALAMLIMF